MATRPLKECYAKLSAMRRIRPAEEEVLRERLENRMPVGGLGVITIMHDDVDLVQEILLVLGAITEALWDVDCPPIQSCLVGENIMRELGKKLCFLPKGRKYKVLGIAKNEISLLETPYSERHYHLVFEKTPDVFSVADDISDEFQKVHGSSHISELVLSPENPLFHILVMLSPYLERDIFGLRAHRPEVIRAYLPLWPIGLSSPTSRDLMFSLYAMTCSKGLSHPSFDIYLLSPAYVREADVPVDNDLTMTLASCLFTDLLEKSGIVEPAGEPAGLQLSLHNRGALRKRLSREGVEGASLAILGVKYIPLASRPKKPLEHMRGDTISKLSDESISRAREGMRIDESHVIGLEQVWVLPSEDNRVVRECINQSYGMMSKCYGEAEFLGVRVLAIPWLWPMVLTKIWLKPYDFMLSWAKSVRISPYALEEIREALDGLCRSLDRPGRARWKEAAEALTWAWDRFEELVRSEGSRS